MTASANSVLRLLPDHWMQKHELIRWAQEVGAEIPPRATKAKIYDAITFHVATQGSRPSVSVQLRDEFGNPIGLTLYSQPPLPDWATPPWLRS